MTSLLEALFVSSLALPAAGAQVPQPFPHAASSRTEAGEVVLTPDHAAIDALRALESVRLDGLPTPAGERLALELERLDPARLRFGFRVDGLRRPELLYELGLTIWKGSVRGEPGSEVLLAFGHHGTRGWIDREGDRLHLVARPHASGDYLLGDVLVTTDPLLAAQGQSPSMGCGLQDVPGSRGGAPPQPPAPSMNLGPGDPCALKECSVAVETDWQLYQVFGNLNALTTYVTTLLTFVSHRYETQVGTVLTFPYLQFYTQAGDPWLSQDSGGNTLALLHEFRTAWAGNVPASARLAHFLSGANLGGGHAWLNVLCNDQYNFAVSGNLLGIQTFPVQPSPTNWDFYIVAHELGHNFASPHSHEYCPPLDRCAPSPYFGQCQTQQACDNAACLMSYCHFCPGGLANMTTYFHPTVAAVMTSAAQACLPRFGGDIRGLVPDLVAPGAATPIQALVSGTPLAGVELRHRSGAAAWQIVPMSHLGQGLWSADLPALACTDDLQVYVQYEDAVCGLLTDPPGAPAQAHTPAVGVPTLLFVDDFEQDLGWTATVLGATSGAWERAVPVDDPGSAYDPSSDFDGSGRCYLTENSPGSSGVVNGSVRLTSPALDLSAGVDLLRYAYFLTLTNQHGGDRLLVEASHTGLAGPWYTVAVHTLDTGLEWRLHSIGGADLAAAGLVPSSDTRFRFTAQDAHPQTVVEAALDAFELISLACDDPAPTAYCAPPAGNSVGPSGAVLSYLSGIPGGLLSLQLEGVPLQPGIFFFGSNAIDQPFGCARRCVGGALTRSGVYSPTSHSFQPVLDTTGSGPGPIKLQFWYRDPAWEPVCGSGFSLSNALAY